MDSDQEIKKAVEALGGKMLYTLHDEVCYELLAEALAIFQKQVDEIHEKLAAYLQVSGHVLMGYPSQQAYHAALSSPRTYNPAPAPQAPAKELTEADVEAAARLKGFTVSWSSGGNYKSGAVRKDDGRTLAYCEGWNVRTGSGKQTSLHELMTAIELAQAKPARAGINNAARVECKRSKHHGFHPADEKCPVCE